ncbi:MAG: hypothetical protein H6Q73_1276 [Firmicutes bacterium]|nr:hypothetical protein [Bacillota bacterium]
MKSGTKRNNKSELERIPGIGKSMAGDLIELGYTTVASLKNQDPEKMYNRHCELKGCCVDRCVLYVFRCAVYFASNEVLEPEKLKWWNWKD